MRAVSLSRCIRAGRHAILVGLLVAGGTATAQDADARRAAEEQRWEALRDMLYAGRTINDGSHLLTLTAPYRAHDAAIVPIDIEPVPQSQADPIKTITLLIDQNPAPIAGRFHFTSRSGIAAISTRVRVNAYSHVRAVAETESGELFMTSRYVKASGGCSAPAGKDQDAAMARLGRMKLRQLDPFVLGKPNRAQILISHPNNTGMQMDQVSRHYVPAHFIKQVEVSYDGEPVLRIESDISISEDPSIHFYYVPEREGVISVKVLDSNEMTFDGAWPVGDS